MSGRDGEVVLAVVLSLPKLCMCLLPVPLHKYETHAAYTRLCTTAGSVNREHLRWTWYWFYWLSLGRGMSDVCQTSEQKEETKLKIHHSDAIVFALVMINAAYRYSPSAITIKFISGCAHWPQWSLPERLSTTHKKSSALFFNSLSVCRELPGTCAELSQWHCSV